MLFPLFSAWLRVDHNIFLHWPTISVSPFKCLTDEEPFRVWNITHFNRSCFSTLHCDYLLKQKSTIWLFPKPDPMSLLSPTVWKITFNWHVSIYTTQSTIKKVGKIKIFIQWIVLINSRIFCYFVARRLVSYTGHLDFCNLYIMMNWFFLEPETYDSLWQPSVKLAWEGDKTWLAVPGLDCFDICRLPEPSLRCFCLRVPFNKIASKSVLTSQ